MATRKKSNKTWQKGEPLAFLQAHVSFDGSECLIWPFTRNPYGYGTFACEGGYQYAHRWMCEQKNGPPPTPAHHATH